MPDYLKISELPVASSVAGTDQIELNQAGTSRSATVALLNPSSTGDFCAVKTAGIGFGTTTPVTVLYDAIRSGNSGSWYSTGTGLYTPPAGRYYMNAVSAFDCAGAIGSTLAIYIRKNGVEQVRSSTTVINAGWAEAIDVSGTFDANGTDYFDVMLTASVASAIGTIANQSSFTAFPISGIKGPPGDPGAMFLSGAGTPTLSAARGTLYTRTDATTTTTRLYVNTDGGTTWANFTASA